MNIKFVENFVLHLELVAVSLTFVFFMFCGIFLVSIFTVI